MNGISRHTKLEIRLIYFVIDRLKPQMAKDEVSAWDEVQRLAELGAAVEAMPEGTSLTRKGHHHWYYNVHGVPVWSNSGDTAAAALAAKESQP